MKNAIFIFLSFILISCIIPHEEESELLHEQAIVRDLIFTPATHSKGSHTTMDLDLNLSFGEVEIKTKASYAFIFECQHGRFVIQGTDKKYENYWKTLKKDEEVNISYKEVYEVNSEGKKILIDYRFVDIVSKNYFNY